MKPIGQTDEYNPHGTEVFRTFQVCQTALSGFNEAVLEILEVIGEAQIRLTEQSETLLHTRVQGEIY